MYVLRKAATADSYSRLSAIFRLNFNMRSCFAHVKDILTISFLLRANLLAITKIWMEAAVLINTVCVQAKSLRLQHYYDANRTK